MAGPTGPLVCVEGRGGGRFVRHCDCLFIRLWDWWDIVICLFVRLWDWYTLWLFVCSFMGLVGLFNSSCPPSPLTTGLTGRLVRYFDCLFVHLWDWWMFKTSCPPPLMAWLTGRLARYFYCLFVRLWDWCCLFVRVWDWWCPPPHLVSEWVSGWVSKWVSECLRETNKQIPKI